MGFYLYKDTANAVWCELDEKNNTFRGVPFGYYMCAAMNTLNSFEGAERFNRNESDWIDNNKETAKELGIVGTQGETRIESFLNEFPIVKKDLWWDEYQGFLAILKEFNYDVLKRKESKVTELLFEIYNKYKYFPAFIMSGRTEFADEYERNEFFEENRNVFIKSAGYDIVECKGVSIPCEKYYVHDFQYAFVLDFWEWLFHPNSQKVKVCKACGILFCSNNTNATYCNICKKDMGKIRYQARKKNVERKLHQEILSMLYTLDDTKELSNAFLNESNYYWDIVSGKDVKKNPAYKKRIRTKEDYMKWLQEQKKAYKKRKEV